MKAYGVPWQTTLSIYPICELICKESSCTGLVFLLYVFGSIICTSLLEEGEIAQIV